MSVLAEIMRFPQRLRELRLKAGLTQKELARRAGVSQALIARIEGGAVNPRLSTLQRIIRVLEEALGPGTRAGDIMHQPVITLHPDEEILKAVRLMEHYGISQIPVVDYEGRLLGTVHETGILKALALHPTPSSLRVADVMEDPLPTVAPSTPVDLVTQMLTEYPAVLVVDRGEIKGIITKIDVVRSRLLAIQHHAQ
jgi:predicted transcriptional regulator